MPSTMYTQNELKIEWAKNRLIHNIETIVYLTMHLHSDIDYEPSEDETWASGSTSFFTISEPHIYTIFELIVL